ncbi:hypothetical protein [Alkalihalobacillus pseudalcaliphilus]|uniref:hypothetical protein n=1 Tax=Alkalihalobacillus pseudalcaliphilus TaxID=79884 RepID=UPI00064E1092|nr:hypothetical protein [Alkalihalobacillus pseudalcaliphilus]KMK75852.1 hypothetical protein AB990_11355 [Alkalihalobacillus pseudalcaliphilus]
MKLIIYTTLLILGPILLLGSHFLLSDHFLEWPIKVMGGGLFLVTSFFLYGDDSSQSETQKEIKENNQNRPR